MILFTTTTRAIEYEGFYREKRTLVSIGPKLEHLLSPLFLETTSPLHADSLTFWISTFIGCSF